MKALIDKIYHTRFFARIFHTVIFCLKKELKYCESVLDLGCGPSSPLQYCKNIKYSVGVETFKPSLEESKKRKIHTEYIEKKIEEVDFPQKCFDAVILIEVLEHLPEETGYAMLKKAEKWAKKKVIVSTPNGFLPQKALDGNPFQKHLSGWSIETMKGLGFRCRGLAGLKFLRQEAPPFAKGGAGDNLMASICLRPRFFWFVMATLSQLITYPFPKYAFELFCTKNLVGVRHLQMKKIK